MVRPSSSWAESGCKSVPQNHSGTTEESKHIAPITSADAPRAGDIDRDERRDDIVIIDGASRIRAQRLFAPV